MFLLDGCAYSNLSLPRGYAELLGLPGAWSAALAGPARLEPGSCSAGWEPGAGVDMAPWVTAHKTVTDACLHPPGGGCVCLFWAESTDLAPTYEVTSQVCGVLCLYITSQRIEVVHCLLPRHHPRFPVTEAGNSVEIHFILRLFSKEAVVCCFSKNMPL